MTTEPYKDMLSQCAFTRFSRLRPDQIFMQDGASPHYSNIARAYLNNKIPGNGLVEEGQLAGLRAYLI